MDETIVLQIPLGFVLKEEKRVMDILSAEQLLLTRKKKQYTMAVREDQMAIQIAGDRILQARTHDNRSLEERSPLYRVIEKWRLQNGLQWGARARFDDAWDDLPMPF